MRHRPATEQAARNLLIDTATSRLEADWQRLSPTPPPIAQYLTPPSDPARVPLLVALIPVDQEWRWRNGDRRLLEAYLEEFPELNANQSALIELLSAECLTRASLAEIPSFRELRTRFSNVCEHVPLEQIRERARRERLTRPWSKVLPKSPVRRRNLPTLVPQS